MRYIQIPHPADVWLSPEDRGLLERAKENSSAYFQPIVDALEKMDASWADTQRFFQQIQDDVFNPQNRGHHLYRGDGLPPIEEILTSDDWAFLERLGETKEDWFTLIDSALSEKKE